MDEADSRKGILFSVALHAAAGVLIFLAPPVQRALSPPPEPIAVKIVTMQQVEAVGRSPEPAVAPAQPRVAARSPQNQTDRPVNIPRAVPQPPAAAAGATGMVHPQHMLSGGVLADARSAKARRQLRTFAPDERIIQLCNLEAMEQVQAWKADFRPETVVAYAMRDLKMAGGSIVADGAAFYSKHNWYGLRFSCDVQADKVVSFAFSVVGAIPHSEWDTHNLSETVADD